MWVTHIWFALGCCVCCSSAGRHIPSAVLLKDGSTPERTYVGGVQHSSDPTVHSWEAVLSAQECKQMIRTAKQVGMVRARVRESDHAVRQQQAGNSGDAGGVDAGRTNDYTWLVHDQNSLTLSVVQRMARVVGLPHTHAESIQVIHYESGEQYGPHFDAYEPEAVRAARGGSGAMDGGQRVVTAMVYLNEPEQGGETEFVNLGLKIAPSTGKMLVFHTCFNGTATSHPDSFHAGRKPATGEKWALNLWFHEHEYPAKGREAAALAASLAEAHLDSDDLRADESKRGGSMDDDGTIATAAADGNGAPSMDELRDACPSATATCERDTKCSASLEHMLANGAPQGQQQPLLTELLSCYLEAAMAEQMRRVETLSRTRSKGETKRKKKKKKKTKKRSGAA